MSTSKIKVHYKPRRELQPSHISRNWATVGFFDASPSLETIRVVTPDIEVGGNVDIAIRNYDRSVSSNHFLDEISIGDVFEVIPIKTKVSNVIELLSVIDIHAKSRSATLKGPYGILKKTWNELLNDQKYIRIVSEKMDNPIHMNRQMSRLQSVRDPLLQERARYSGIEGKKGIYSLFRQLPDDDRVCDLNSSLASPITPRLAFIRACRRERLPPIPILAMCHDNEFPSLDLSEQSLGNRFCDAIAESLPFMTFLREVNFSGNRFDSKTSSRILISLYGSNIESIILDHNKIGKNGVNALLVLISGEHKFLSDMQRPSTSTLSGTGKVSNNISLPLLTMLPSPVYPNKGSSSISAAATPVNRSASVVSQLMDDEPPADKERAMLMSPSASKAKQRKARTVLNKNSGVNSITLIASSLNPNRLFFVRISVNDNNLGDSLVSMLVDSVTLYCFTLNVLNIKGNLCSMSTSKSVKKLLMSEHHKSLSEIDLSWNNLHSHGGDAVLLGVTHSKSLHTIKLDWNGLGDEVTPTLNLCVKKSTSIELISLKHNHISEASIELIIQQCKRDIKIISLGE